MAIASLTHRQAYRRVYGTLHQLTT